MEITRGNRIYNGLSSKLMNDIYDGLISRCPEIINEPYWDILSLYLARTCGVIEDKNYHSRPHIQCLKRCDDNKCDCIKDFIEYREDEHEKR